jgi:hypothetical protein
MGFVALADLLFALSAGLLLLNPPRIAPPEPAPQPLPQAMAQPASPPPIDEIGGELQRLAMLLDKLEGGTGRIERQANELLKGE